MKLFWACCAEMVGTYLMVAIGTGVVAAAVITGAHAGLWQVAMVWGLVVTLAIYVTAAASGAHLNPAVTLAFALCRPREFPAVKVVPYWGAQLLGAFIAGLTVWLVFGAMIESFEETNRLVRGAAGSELSAMVFGQYFPNPDIIGTDPDSKSLVSPLAAMLVEGFGTAILVFVIFALVDPSRASLSNGRLTPVLVGVTIALLIAVFAPLTQGGWNPARDFGPRLVAFIAGWDSVAIPGPSNGFWVYIVGPLAGGPIGALAYEILLRPAIPKNGEINGE